MYFKCHGRKPVGIYFSMLALREKRGSHLPMNTSLGRAFGGREQEYLADIGGVESTSLAESQMVNDSTWCDFLILLLDFQLSTKRQIVRKGKPVASIELRMRLAAPGAKITIVGPQARHPRKDFR